MSDKAHAPEPLQDLQQLHGFPSPTAPFQSEVFESPLNSRDTARDGTFRCSELENDHEDMRLQNSTAHTALIDLPSQSSSNAENPETSTTESHRHAPVSDESNERWAPASALSEHGQGTTLSFRFGSILVLLNRLVQTLGELPEKALPEKELSGKRLLYTRLGDTKTFLEDYDLDLRIWLKDMTNNDVPTLDRLDDMKNPQEAAMKVITNLHETMTDIGNILLSSATRFNTSPLASSHSKNLLELSMACNELKSLLQKLVAQKSAIKEVLALLSTERLTSTKDLAAESKARLASTILCFDGGGVRSYSSLLILKALMDQVQSVFMKDKTPMVEMNGAGLVHEVANVPQLRPADVFDFMYGSSSGGLIAIMLGRLGMTVDECIAKYLEYTRTIFSHPRRFSVGGYLRSRYSQKLLIQATRRTVGEFDPSPRGEEWSRNIFSSPNAPCKTGVLAWRSERFEPYMFRTFDCFARPDSASRPLNPGPADPYQIWQIAMATVAAPTFFDPPEIEGQVFADGGITVNNPTQEALRDMDFLNDTRMSRVCVVSIGSGLGTEHRLPKHISKALNHAKSLRVVVDAARQLVSQTELTHRTVKDLLGQSEASYFRFNISGVGDIRLDEWQKADLTADLTSQYLQDTGAQDRLNDCANLLIHRLRERQGKSAKVCSSPIMAKQPEADKAQHRNSLRSQKSRVFVSYHVPFSLRGVPVAKRFIDRPLEMAKLEEAFFSYGDQRQRVFILSGLGGIGKTQLSVEFARRHKSRFSSIFWLDGRSEDTLRQSVAAIAHRIPHGQIPKSSKTPVGLDAVIEDVMNWLSMPDNGSWLLIYDNVDQDYQIQELQTPSDAYDVRSYFPKADHGSIIITTRVLNLGQLGTHLVLEKLDDQQAVAIFKDGYGRGFEGSDESKELLDILHGLPLALVNASTFMRETATSFSDYIKFYKEQWIELMRSSHVLSEEYQHSILATWTLSYEAIYRRDESAAKLLRLWACLDNKELWFELLHAAFTKLASAGERAPKWFQKIAGNKLAFSKSISLLLGYSMIRGTEDSSGYSVHPLVHQWAWQTQQEDPRTEFTVLATLVVGLAVPHNSQKEFWVVQRRLLPHADRCVRIISEYATEGHPLRGHSNAFENTASRYTLISEAFHNLGNLYMNQGELAEAEAMYKRALAEKEKTLGQEHLSTLDTVDSLGDLYHARSEYSEAEQMYRRALAGKEKILEQGHSSILDTTSHLAQLFHSQGNLDHAEEIYIKALASYEETLKPDHISTLYKVNKLGNLYHSQDRFKQVGSMYQRALAGHKNTLGPDHTLTLPIFNNLGIVYAAQGNLMEAEKMYQRALNGTEKALGPMHPNALDIVYNLGSLYKDQGNLTEAEKMYQRALDGTEKVLGPMHPSVLDTVCNLGNLYKDQGNLTEAEKMYQRALDGTEKTLGPMHLYALDTVNDLGNLYRDQGKLAEAKMMYLRALKGYEKLRGPDHPTMKLIRHNLNSILGTGEC